LFQRDIETLLPLNPMELFGRGVKTILVWALLVTEQPLIVPAQFKLGL
jgi:hypothetical protein